MNKKLLQELNTTLKASVMFFDKSVMVILLSPDTDPTTFEKVCRDIAYFYGAERKVFTVRIFDVRSEIPTYTFFVEGRVSCS